MRMQAYAALPPGGAFVAVDTCIDDARCVIGTRPMTCMDPVTCMACIMSKEGTARGTNLCLITANADGGRVHVMGIMG